MLARNRTVATAAALLPLLLGACVATPDGATAPLAHADIVNSSGQSVGSAVISPAGNGLAMRITAQGLTPGVHGMHFHASGSCEAPAFTSAGAHLNPHGRMHGTENPQGSHLGDLPNITAMSDGRVDVSVPLNLTPSELQANLFDADGTAIVIHASPDDYRTDPSGNSGSRIACGVLVRG